MVNTVLYDLKARIILSGKSESGEQLYLLRFSSNSISKKPLTIEQLKAQGWSMSAKGGADEAD